MRLRKLWSVLLLAFCIGLSITPISAASAGVTAKPTNSSVFINGIAVDFTAYNIGGNNYFKLRDLAAALNSTEKKFSVRYDGASKRIYLETGQVYSPIGGELETNVNPAPKTASPTSETLFCNNVNIRCTAYKIDGANYFKLRDIMKVMDIGVTWDSTISPNFLGNPSMNLQVRLRYSWLHRSSIYSFLAISLTHSLGIPLYPYARPASPPATAATVSVSSPRLTAFNAQSL